MVENFGGSILYLILFLIQLLGLSFYSYLVILNPKKIIDDYQVGEGAIAPIRLIGSFIVPLVLIGIYLLFTSIEGAWIYFILGLLTSLYQLLYDMGTRFGIIDKGYTIVNKTQDTIISIVFVVANVVLITGLSDKIYAWTTIVADFLNQPHTVNGSIQGLHLKYFEKNVTRVKL